MGRFSLSMRSVKSQYITQYYIFYLNSNDHLNIDPFQALYAFVSVVKWIIPAVPIQLLTSTYPQISDSNRTVWL